MKKLIILLLIFCFSTAHAEDLWEVQLYEEIGSLFDLQFIGDEGWAVGRSSYPDGAKSQVIYTANLGKTWTKRNPPLNQGLFSVCFIDNKRGWVVGDEGSILFTETGGLSWDIDTTIEKSNYRCVYFRDINQGWVAGSDSNSEGILLETMDGGKLWKEKELPYPVSELTKIYFIDSLNGFLLGNYPTTIFRTNDGGETWSYQSFEIKEGINSVHFIDKDNGWICGGYYRRGEGSTSLLLKTCDGGLSWDIRQNELQCVFDDIYFYSNRIGYAVANAPNGIFYKSTDGGINWNVIDLKIPNLFLSKFIPKKNTAWIAGSDMWGHGIIFKGILDLELMSNSQLWQSVLVDPNTYKRDGKQYPYSPYQSKNGAIKLMNYGKQTVTLDKPEIITDIKGSSFKALLDGNIVSLNQNNNLSVLLANRNLFAGNELIIPVFFDPKESGYHRLEIRFDNNSEAEPITVLEGYAGFPIISTSDLYFGNVDIGTGSVEKTVNFNFLNWEFDYPLTITDFVVDNNELFTEKSGSGIFRWDRNSIVDKYGNSVTLPITLNKDDFLTIAGEFEPTESGEYSVSLTTISNAEIEAVSTWKGAAIVSSVKDKTISGLTGFEIIPNPSKDFITIKLSNKGLQPFAEGDKVQIFDMLGIEVISVETGLRPVSTKVDLSHLAAGVYFIRIGSRVEKFVKI